MPAHVVTSEDVEKTIAAFTRLDQRGDKRAMNKLAQRLQKEQPFLLQHAAAVRGEHGDTVGEAAVFYATLVWAMFDRGQDSTMPRLTQQNLADADKIVTDETPAEEGMMEYTEYVDPKYVDKIMGESLSLEEEPAPASQRKGPSSETAEPATEPAVTESGH